MIRFFQWPISSLQLPAVVCSVASFSICSWVALSLFHLAPLHADLLSLMVQNCTKLLTFLWPENASHSHSQQLDSSQTWGTHVLQHPWLIGLSLLLCARKKGAVSYTFVAIAVILKIPCHQVSISFIPLKTTNQSSPLLAPLPFNTALTYL